jgi:hypothetical protein
MVVFGAVVVVVLGFLAARVGRCSGSSTPSNEPLN